MTTKTVRLHEAGTLIREEAREDGAFKVRIINSGQGSSGFYSSEMLEKYHRAFDNALSFHNHPTSGDPSTRDFTMISGRIMGETWTQQEPDGSLGVYGWYLPDPEFAEKLERYKDSLGLSIFIEGDGKVNSSGVFEVDYLNESDPYRSVDVVIAPGRGGRLAVESLKKVYDTLPESGERNREDTSGMTIEELAGLVNDLSAKIDTLVSEQDTKAQEQAQAEADQEAVEAALSAYEEKVAQIESADLLPVQVESLRALARKGVDVSEEIENAKAVLTAVKESMATDGAAPGRIVESGTDEGYTLRGYKEAK